MPVYQIDGLTPVIDPSSYVHPTAVLIGDVIIGKNVYIGPNASLRGDFGRLIIKDGSNIQDNCVIHGYPQQDTVVEENGHIGHGAILHACQIRRNVLIGMNSVIMDGAEIGENCIVGAMAFIKADATFSANQLIIGSPARALRDLTEQELEWKRISTLEYQTLVTRCKETLQEAEPLTEVEPDRKRMVFSPDFVPKNQL
ncbi:phenylacetic acid degradation protein PaaY [Xenorhabdus szentirmaii]|uniref:Phenylacetic acid degradation protein paaY n=2 Tax=Xenorhabdus szentirmaii TaxID=290112 RepID=W1J5A7_9GAMM|nr:MULTISPECIES: phenylacetic acid degradation protein PaaY [Xenorhabdus]MBD2780250.1 phenylacetic acid degradation protein PaaY [Xenorhabdus sp. 38]MBD2790776.1 phenylacetic acid degradation protein PaaY [Xenorhabdus sp. CUL]MBD2800107.1 phenylacetic acid degradation protein PaaY [Xenorhabdus sp. M]MBD2804910.1 phenylacetic acid degradation protein PaaY [Xenorhabdus sp. ZM]MBD2820634.1 phenylacetic acid degradation protein PaaY [Xenorhabdus sp. 42]